MTELTPNSNPTPQKLNPWKIGVLAAASLGAAVLAGTAVVRTVDDEPEQVASATPPPKVVEDCNRYAADAIDTRKVAKDGLLGGAVGAGVGAAGGAIADGGDGAGKGAGIGAIVGATAGTFYGLSEENRRTEASRHAYRECMERNGYRS